MKYLVVEIIKAFWMPLLFLLIAIFVLFLFIDFKNKKIFQIVLGVILAVAFGFIADMSKRSFDSLQDKLKLRNVALRLLEEDAKSVYRTVWLWDKLQKSTEIPPEAKKGIPPELRLKYWECLKDNHDFLMLAIESPFDKIFKELWELEEINYQIKLAKAGNQQAALFAITFYNILVKDNSHRKLLLFFISEKVIEDLDRKYIDTAREKHKEELSTNITK